MTSFVLSPFADARTCLYKTIFDGFGGIWTPKCCRTSCGPPKGTSLRHNACFEPSRAKFRARVTSVGESDVINCAKFYRNRLRGLDSMSGQSLTFPLDCDIAVNTVWTTVHTVIYNYLQNSLSFNTVLWLWTFTYGLPNAHRITLVMKMEYSRNDIPPVPLNLVAGVVGGARQQTTNAIGRRDRAT